MAAELPYFKFYSSKWTDGDITLEDFDVQGLFINLCSQYWSKDGVIKLSKMKRRFKHASKEMFKTLIDSDLIKVEDDIISISFLDEQLEARKKLSETNSLNGKKGGRPPKKSKKKPTALNSDAKKKPNESNIEEKRREESREEENRIEDIEEVFINPVSPLFDKIRYKHKKEFLICAEMFDKDIIPKNEEGKMNWVQTFDRLVRIDKYSPQRIVDLVTFARKDKFWRKNLLSFLALRKKNDSGVMKIKSIEAQYKPTLNKKKENNGESRGNNKQASTFLPEGERDYNATSFTPKQ